MDRELEMLLRLGVRALSKLPGGLLQGGERHFVSLSEKAQVRVAAERSVMAEFAQEIAHGGMILQIPGRQVRG